MTWWPCFICGSPEVCAHREPEIIGVVQARNAAARRDERDAYRRELESRRAAAATPDLNAGGMHNLSRDKSTFAATPVVCPMPIEPLLPPPRPPERAESAQRELFDITPRTREAGR
jgi:hypothetical protein